MLTTQLSSALNSQQCGKMDVFVGSFWGLCVICASLYFYTRTAVPGSNDARFRIFRRTYFVVYLLAMAGDWLQGPYVYALYQHYGMTKHDIEVLFVAGFGASMLIGTVIGSFADRYGRRANCILYGILYALSCVTKHFNNFWLLMLGRLLGGTATSILYSAFESWLVCEHNKQGFDASLLESVFTHAVFGNSVVAILSGVVAQQFADVFGYVAPFDISIIVLVIMIFFLAFTWVENYGDAKADTIRSFRSAITSIRSDSKVLCLGIIQSLFEGSMYTFVLEWTPALTPAPAPTQQPATNIKNAHVATIPHGYIFAAFMVCVMIGSSLFNILARLTSVESVMRYVFLVSAVSLSMPILFPGKQAVIFYGFLVFEISVGIFWPALGTMRSRYVPEASRATIMNIFRVPLNLIVVIILTQGLSLIIIFQCCVIFLLITTLFQHWLYRESRDSISSNALLQSNENGQEKGQSTDVNAN